MLRRMFVIRNRNDFGSGVCRFREKRKSKSAHRIRVCGRRTARGKSERRSNVSSELRQRIRIVFHHRNRTISLIILSSLLSRFFLRLLFVLLNFSFMHIQVHPHNMCVCTMSSHLISTTTQPPHNHCLIINQSINQSFIHSSFSHHTITTQSSFNHQPSHTSAAQYESVRTGVCVRVREYVKGPVREARYVHVEYQQLRTKLDAVEKQIASESKKSNSQKLAKVCIVRERRESLFSLFFSSFFLFVCLALC